MCQEKLVQEAVDTLLDNGIRGQPIRHGKGRATCLHYLFISIYDRAYFDGDQMAVHVPLSLEAKVTARLFTYVFSYESLVSSYWGSYFRTNSRYAYRTLFINDTIGNGRERTLLL
uniref:RNA polymerase alpha subunit domain-containing protein n=1 Tax=Musa acuminata subsp. malaccensis TaxID=214687 RepID=A0A804U5S7_MUSAM